jgi:post-segregation antitoxin (ccd killing protein)
LDITVYLPDKLGAQAKKAELNLSGLLRAAVTEELERRQAVSKTLKETQEQLLTVEDDEGRTYDARLVGREIAHDDQVDAFVYLTDDERVILYDADQLKYWDISDDPDQALSDLPPGAYAEAMHALGLKPVIDI